MVLTLGFTLYYDDFLGQTSLENKLNKNEEQRLLQFIETVKKTKNARFILTTREYILNQAKTIYEKISSSDFDSQKCVIDLSNFTKFDKAKILYNHVYFSNLSIAQKYELIDDKNYFKIINHPNYSPRIIEWMTEYSKLSRENGQTYSQVFLSALNNPSKIWEHAFLNQISNSARDLLLVLSSLPDEVFIDDLMCAFNSFHSLQSQIYGQGSNPNDFKKALKEVECNFIRIEKSDENLVVSFHNPSIRDFLNIYLRENINEVATLCKSATYFQQCKKIWEIINSTQQSDESVNKSENEMIIARFSYDFWKAMANTFESKSIHLVNVHRYNSQSIHEKIFKQRGSFSLESRIVFTLQVAKLFIVAETKNIIQQMLDSVVQNIKKNSTKSDLLYLLNFANEFEIKFQVSVEPLIVCSKELILKNLDSFEDYETLIKFKEKYPEYILEDEYIEIVDNFNNYYLDEVDWIIANTQNVGDVEDEIDTLKIIGHGFCLDVSSGVDRLEKYSDELVDPNDYNEDEVIDRFDSPQIDGDQEISSLFETLL